MMKRGTLIAFLFSLLLLTGACESKEKVEDTNLTPLKIGLILPLTGSGAEIGALIKEGSFVMSGG